MKAFQIHANTRRHLTEEERLNKESMGPDFWPPWMETGLIRVCRRCHYEIWEYIALPDGCISCGSTMQIAWYNRKPTWWEKFVHYWKVDNKFTGKDAVAGYGKQGQED